MSEPITWLSDCHDAPVKAVAGDEGTSHYECTECGEACDFSATPAQPEATSQLETFSSIDQAPKPSESTGEQEDMILEVMIRAFGGPVKAVRQLLNDQKRLMALLKEYADNEALISEQTTKAYERGHKDGISAHEPMDDGTNE